MGLQRRRARHDARPHGGHVRVHEALVRDLEAADERCVAIGNPRRRDRSRPELRRKRDAGLMEEVASRPSERLADHRGMPVVLSELGRARGHDRRGGEKLRHAAGERLVAVPDRTRLDVRDPCPRSVEAQVVERPRTDQVVDDRAGERRLGTGIAADDRDGRGGAAESCCPKGEDADDRPNGHVIIPTRQSNVANQDSGGTGTDVTCQPAINDRTTNAAIATPMTNELRPPVAIGNILCSPPMKKKRQKDKTKTVNRATGLVFRRKTRSTGRSRWEPCRTAGRHS